MTNEEEYNIEGLKSCFQYNIVHTLSTPHPQQFQNGLDCDRPSKIV